MTREEIKNNMLEQISDKYDKSEGSFFYDVIKALAVELENAYVDQNEILNQGFVETAVGGYLDKKVAQQGISRKSPVKATSTVTITGSEGAIVEEGMLVATDVVNFVVKESKTIDASGDITVEVECEIAGTIGNVPTGAIKHFPVTIPGFISVTNPSPVSNGYDGETDEDLRKRYYDKVRTPATSGNKYHYRNWALEIPGVGDVRVFPLWNEENGTVKVVLIDVDKTGAEQELVEEVHKHIEENRPIGVTLTTISAAEIPINIEVNLTVDIDNYTVDEVKSNIESNITDYLKEIAFIEGFVSHARIGSIILQSQGVLDYKGLIINGKGGSDADPNIKIEDEEVAVLGVITIV